MELSIMREKLSRFDEICERLKSYGIDVTEHSGFSDRHYYSIAASNPHPAYSGDESSFCGNDVFDFITKAEVYLKAREHAEKEAGAGQKSSTKPFKGCNTYYPTREQMMKNNPAV